MKRRPQRFPVAPPLTPEQQERVDRFDRMPPAPESFRHLTTCQGTPDAPALCECPPSHIDVQGTGRVIG